VLGLYPSVEGHLVYPWYDNSQLDKTAPRGDLLRCSSQLVTTAAVICAGSYSNYGSSAWVIEQHTMRDLAQQRV